MASFNYSAEKTEALSDGSFINESGFYVGELIEAYEDISKGGAKFIRFTFQAPQGKANFDIYYTNRDGERIQGADIISGGLLKVLRLRGIKSVPGRVKIYDFELGEMVEQERETHPDILNKPLGVILQKVIYIKQNGEEGFYFNLKHFTDTTGATATELLHALEPKTYKFKPRDMFSFRRAGLKDIPYDEYLAKQKQYNPNHKSYAEPKSYGEFTYGKAVDEPIYPHGDPDDGAYSQDDTIPF